METKHIQEDEPCISLVGQTASGHLTLVDLDKMISRMKGGMDKPVNPHSIPTGCSIDELERRLHEEFKPGDYVIFIADNRIDNVVKIICLDYPSSHPIVFSYQNGERCSRQIKHFLSQAHKVTEQEAETVAKILRDIKQKEEKR